MNRSLARVSLLVFGVFFPALLIVTWITTPSRKPPPPQIPSAPRQILPNVLLPEGSDPESVALRRSILNGERIYQRLCYNCHGRRGKGDNNPYMESIGHKPADHTDLLRMQKLSDWELFLALRDGVKDERGWLTMPPWESVLTPTEMWDVVTYVRWLPLTALPNRRPSAPSRKRLPPLPPVR